MRDGLSEADLSKDLQYIMTYFHFFRVRRDLFLPPKRKLSLRSVWILVRWSSYLPILLMDEWWQNRTTHHFSVLLSFSKASPQFSDSLTCPPRAHLCGLLTSTWRWVHPEDFSGACEKLCLLPQTQPINTKLLVPWFQPKHLAVVAPRADRDLPQVWMLSLLTDYNRLHFETPLTK